MVWYDWYILLYGMVWCGMRGLAWYVLVHYGMVSFTTYGLVRLVYPIVCYGMVLFSVTWYGMACGLAWYDLVHYSMVYDMVRYRNIYSGLS